MCLHLLSPPPLLNTALRNGSRERNRMVSYSRVNLWGHTVINPCRNWVDHVTSG